jgi:subtilase family serine protease
VLAAGGVSTLGRSVGVPTTIPLGLYYALACADDLSNVAETNETNNCKASSAEVRVGWPDLLLTAITNPPPMVPGGGSFSITDSVLNQGAILAGASTIQYYLSLDSTKSVGDLLLAGIRPLASLAAGATVTGSRIVVVPAPTAPGTYFVIGCADALSKIGENNESNNCRASVSTVAIHP